MINEIKERIDKLEKENKMTENTELNKQLHEITGLSHQIDFVNTWTGFGILWEFMQRHKLWESFIIRYGGFATHTYCISIHSVNPKSFATIVTEFFEAKK